MGFNFIPVRSNEQGGHYKSICSLGGRLKIFHGVFIYNGVPKVTIKFSGTCVIIFFPSLFYGENRPAAKYQNMIHLSGVDVTTLVWSRVVAMHFVLLVDHVFDLCQIVYHQVPTGGVVISEFGHCNSGQSKVMDYGVPRHVVIHKVSGGCC